MRDFWTPPSSTPPLVLLAALLPILVGIFACLVTKTEYTPSSLLLVI